MRAPLPVLRVADRLLSQRGLQLRRIEQDTTQEDRPLDGSFFAEDVIAERLLQHIDDAPRFCVDIGASDGRTMSNSLRLFSAGWAGLAVEVDGPKFGVLAGVHAGRDVSLIRSRVTPRNVAALLEAAGTPRNFGFLTVDIDGYDYWVLDELLRSYRPGLIAAEINEKIPPPLRFTVNYSDAYVWDTGHCYGQSISQVEVLCRDHGYVIVELEYNNVFLMPAEVAPSSMSAVEAYELGYAGRSDRLERMPWNADMEALQSLGPVEAEGFVRERFAGFAGSFSLTVDG